MPAASFIFRLKRILMIAPDDAVDEQPSLVEQGMDSLMAVEVRSWFLNEMEVDMPVLKILAGGTIAGLLAEAVDRVPASIIDIASLPDLNEAGNRSKRARLAKPQLVPPPLPAVGDQSSEAASLSESTSDSQPHRLGTSSSSSMTLATPTSPVDTLNEVSADDGVHAIARIPNNELTVPVSYGQTGFWFLHEYLADKTTFNMTAMFKLSGTVDVPRLERAVQALGRRHEPLRTRYFWAGEGDQRAAMQGILQVDDKDESPVRLVERRVASESEADAALTEMHQHQWDLGSWEAAKIHLLTVDKDTHFLLAGAHHISWDAYSFNILFSDLAAEYEGRLLPPLGPENQYRGFVQHQRELHENGAFVATLDELRAIISPDLSPIPPFPFARSPTRPSAVDSFVQFEATATLPLALADKLRRLARKHSATAFHVYLAALHGLVLRLLPETDSFFVGIADAGRLDQRVMGSLGLFLNLLPLRFTRGTTPTRISNLIRGARDAAYAALERSHVPWSVVLNELKIPRASTHSPVFQLFVDYRQAPVVEQATFGECSVSGEAVWRSARTGYDVMLNITDNPRGGAALELRLAADMYDEESAGLLMRAFMHILERFVEGEDCDVTELPAYAPADVERGLRVGKGTC